jgi:hypothetical protein
MRAKIEDAERMRLVASPLRPICTMPCMAWPSPNKSALTLTPTTRSRVSARSAMA